MTWEQDPEVVRAAAVAAGCRVLSSVRLADGHAGYRIRAPGLEAKIQLLEHFADLDAREPNVRRVAELVAAAVPGEGPTLSEARRWELARAVHRFVLRMVRFVPEKIETFSSPLHVLGVGLGDCDDSSRCVVALLRSLGQPARFALMRGKSGSHVAAQVRIAGAWRWLETTVNARAGEAPLAAARRVGIAGRNDLG